MDWIQPSALLITARSLDITLKWMEISDIYIKYKDEQNYDAFKMPEVILSQ